MYAREYQSHQLMLEIKTLLKLLVESQCSQLSTQNQILDILQSIGNAGNRYKTDNHKAFRNPSSSYSHKPQATMLSPTTVLTPEEDANKSSNATAKVSENGKESPSVVLEEITQALPEDNNNEQYQQPPFEHQLCDFTGNNTTMERNLKSNIASSLVRRFPGLVSTKSRSRIGPSNMGLKYFSRSRQHS
ncbi:uncharacterized protein LOC113341721 [Papaver somniferum]|uniref:uncharacterized protein LOC113341721 n=1 Tax=Papaver somniferum TaxID=3469 RepID=UPI000E6F6394|nr:uncharacterized protein LOC113341721 [Papaver somniferum]